MMRLKTKPREVYARWWGGPTYSLGDHESIEVFASLTAAQNALYFRERNGHWQKQDFRYVVNSRTEQVFTPTVEQKDSLIEVWFDLSEDMLAGSEDLPEPDRYVFFGPRGGVRCSPYLPSRN